MIRTESEYQECLKRLQQDLDHISRQRQHLKSMDLSAKQVEKALQPAYSFHEQLKEEVEWYERIKRRDFGTIHNLKGVGQLLVALRIANNISQKELAARLNIDESQISRDEKNEYHGISVERAQRILNSLGEYIELRVEEKVLNEDKLAIARQ